MKTSSCDIQFPQDGGSFCSTKDAMMAAAGAVVARSRSKSELAGLLAALHDDLTHQIHAEVSEFWSVLETVAAARHAELLGVLNKHLQELSAKVEAAVSCSLDVRLAPVKLALAPQNIAQFHCSLEALIAAGEVHKVNERIKRPTPGICRWGHYWEDVPHMRTVVEAYTTSVYELAPSEITKLFINMVDSAISATESQLEAYVSKFVGDQLSQARQELERYSESYLGTMTSALEVGQMGAEHRLAALDKVKAVLGRVDTLGAEVDALLATVEQGVPRAREPCIAFDDLEELEELEVSSTVGAAAAAAEGLKQNVTSVKGALAPEEHVGGDGALGDLQHQKQEQQGTLEGVSSGERQQAAAVMGLVQAAAAAASAAGYAGGAGAADGRLWQQPTEQLQPQQQELEQEQRDGETGGQRGQASDAGSPPSSPIAATETAGQCDVRLGLPVTNASVHTGQQKEQDATAGVLAAQPDEPDAHHGSAAGAEFDLQHLTASQASLGESAVQVPAVQGAAVDEASSCKGEHLPAPSSPGSNTGSCCDEWAVVEGNGKQEQQQQ
ncbi:hypothetical protein DUNSADRAFT_18020 [Dunaliella salina]|uniref:Uncharacterized protein n=1 Tax=Dunaliella salina TaxID=3046 RepID=A0ABQ7G0S7_DUNSA|nr:hypothetical protein DUNSADRAFT_18020 [Dunaliella salina]|eukprot:KAF5828208.1 hypothetical protein DUNSADRAFT_18020 [Dunaliella salina]